MIQISTSFSQIPLQDKPFCFTKEQAQYLAKRKVVADYCDSLEVVYQNQLVEYKDAVDVQGKIIVGYKQQVDNLNKIVSNDSVIISDKDRLLVKANKKIKKLIWINSITGISAALLAFLVIIATSN